MDLIERSGSASILPESSSLNHSKIVTSFEFIGEIDTPNTLLLRNDYSGRLSFLIVNSMHKLYCQMIFISNSTSCVINLFNLVTADDHLPFDS